MNKFKKIIGILSIVLILINSNGYGVLAQEIPTAPPAPTAPPVPTIENNIPTAPPAPTTPPTPSPIASQIPSPEVQATPKPTKSPKPYVAPTPTVTPDTVSGNTNSPSASPDPSTVTSTGSETQNGQSGGSNITTGDANTTGSIVTNANTNEATVSGEVPSSTSATNQGNGTDSNNNSSVVVQSDRETNQINVADVNNSLVLGSITGDNSASKNTGGDNVIKTGDANTSGTIITAINTNVSGVSISEFNVVDDHVGDIILDFGSNCISGCSAGSSSQNTQNGSGSLNNSVSDANINNKTFQSNDATVENSMTLASNTGDNKTDKNTGGDNLIQTGDANVSASVLTFANNNLSGNVYYGVVNVYGSLNGDIVLPQELVDQLIASNTNNGSSSVNNSSVSKENTNVTTQSNEANIQNNLVLDAQTGDNNSSKNTNGDSVITTGDSTVDANVLNIANSNVNGGTWWLVIVNEAGKWVGRIVGAPTAENGNIAGSSGSEFLVNSDGSITATNSGNGSGSTNNSSISNNTDNETTQTNNANIVNNLDLSANSGGNEASKNTGGSSYIQTGDANIIANLINFVNNNIAGEGKLLVTVVNVFGSWLGDFITPGAVKDAAQTPEVVSNNNNVSEILVSTQTTSNNQSQNSVVLASSTTETKSTNSVLGANTRSSYKSLGSSVQSISESLAPHNSELAYALTSTGTKVRDLNLNLAWLVPFMGVGLLVLLAKKIRHLRARV